MKMTMSHDFKVGDLVSYNYPASRDVGPWSGSGTVVTAEPDAFKIEVRSNHNGINYWRPVSYCKLISRKEERKKNAR